MGVALVLKKEMLSCILNTFRVISKNSVKQIFWQSPHLGENPVGARGDSTKLQTRGRAMAVTCASNTELEITGCLDFARRAVF
jgi:hypothetical protein